MSELVLDGRYVLAEQIGFGGMGSVYRASDRQRDDMVAVKILLPQHRADGPEAARMLREARAGAAISHPHVVRVRDSGVVHGRPFIVMEFVDGRPLRQLAGWRPIEPRRLAAVIGQILAGVDAIHRAGFAHGDLAPANILVAERADGLRATIIDLGLACELATDDRATPHATISGTPDYIAPELVGGGAKSVASDLYAVGAILYELLTGRAPFGGGSPESILHRHVFEDVDARPIQAGAAGPALQAVVLRALAKRPSDRFADARSFADAVARATAGGPAPPAEAPGANLDEVRTADWTLPTLPTQPPAPPPPPATIPGHRRRAVNVIDDALERARTCLARYDPQAAVRVLETAVAEIGAQPEPPPDTWRLLVPLAALYRDLGLPRRARFNAGLALTRAARAGSSIGCQRAEQVLARMVSKGER